MIGATVTETAIVAINAILIILFLKVLQSNYLTPFFIQILSNGD